MVEAGPVDSLVTKRFIINQARWETRRSWHHLNSIVAWTERVVLYSSSFHKLSVSAD